MAKDSGSNLRIAFPHKRQSRKRPDSRRQKTATGPWDKIRAALGQTDWRRICLAIITVVALSALLSLHLLPDRVRARPGDISSVSVRARVTVQYIDKERTAALREAASERVEPVYERMPYASADADETVQDIVDYLRRERSSPSPSATHLAVQLRQHLGVVVGTSSLLEPLLKDPASGYHIDQLERVLRDSAHDALQEDIRNDSAADLQRALAVGNSRLQTSLIARDYLPAATALLNAVVRPNRVYDAEKTEWARETARRTVAPVYSQIFAGDPVIRRGELVTPATIDKLHALGLQNPSLERGMVIGVSMLVAIMVAVVCLYLARHHRSVFRSTKMLVLLSLIANLSILGLKLADTLMGMRLSGPQFGYAGMLAVASAGMLIAALVNTRVALVVSTLLAAQSGLILGYDVRFPVMTLLSTLVALFAVSDIRSRSDLLRATVILSCTNLLLTAIVGRIEGDAWSDIGRAGLWAVVSGALAVGIFSLGAALFERMFGITTHLGLLELCDPNRRLLQEFCQVAPGTYTHSVMVGNLAVAAAEAIGADALLCRVGAYYHDLGKMRRAEFFVENQGGGDNAHDKLNPSLSALVVTAHVKDGLEIAEQEKLPPVVKAFITEHHGTSLIRYFYHQHTCGDCPEDDGPGLEQHFRYGGPKPQSRETAILMLSDGVEAASRTLERPTLGRIEDLVDKIINAQLQDGQLDECDLTLRDLRGIRNAFVHLLGGMLHNRIEYPEVLRQNATRQDKPGSTDKPADEVVSVAETKTEAEVGDHSSVAA